MKKNLLFGKGTPARIKRGRELRDAAIEQVDEHANDEWKEVAYDIVLQLANARHPFTADHVWDNLPPETQSTHEPRALGAIIRRAALAKLITKTGRMVPSVRPIAHRNPKTEWIGT